MASNLVNEIIRMASPAILDKLSQVLGIKSDVAQKGLLAAIPAVIGMLVNKSGTPTGARDIFSSLTNASPDVGSGLVKSLTGAGASAFAQGGSGMLGSLFGDSTASVVSNVVGKFAGLDAKSSSGLMGVATQMIMGGLAKEKASGGLDASGLASLLSAQKSNVASAMPAGLGSLLAAAPGLASSFSGFSSAAASSTAAAREATQSVNRMATNAAEGSGNKWIAGLVALALIGGGYWYFTQSKAPVTTTTTTTTTDTTTTQPATGGTTTTTDTTTTQPAVAPSLVVDGVDVGKAATDALAGLTTALGGVTDATTAQAAVTTLQAAPATVDGLIAQVAKLSPEQKAAFAPVLAPAITSLQAAVTKAMAIPGVGDILKPVIEPLMAKIVLLAR